MDKTKFPNFTYLSCWDPDSQPNKQVVTVFLQKGNSFLALQRARKDGQHQKWGIPGGKLDQNELPLSGLIRELQEETGLRLQDYNFQLLGKALSQTPCDGLYGLYLYHCLIEDDLPIQIDTSEHYEYKWVTKNEFLALDLLTAQREAFQLVETLLEKAMNQKENSCAK